MLNSSGGTPMNKGILFIDEEPEYIRPYIEALRDEGYKVTLATTVDQAYRLLDEQEFDLIVLDLIMPPGQSEKKETREELNYAETGIRLCKYIRDKLGFIDIPIIFLTVVTDPTIHQEIRKLERRYGLKPRILIKPILPSEVVTEVRKVLQEFQGLYL